MKTPFPLAVNLPALVARGSKGEVLEILHVPDPRLREVSTPVDDFDEFEELKPFFDKLIEKACSTKNCAGLAAPQVGVLKRVIVVFLEKGKPTLMVNPVLVDPKEVDGVDRTVCIQEVQEGCLSVPEKFTLVKRPDSVGVLWQDELGAHHKAVFTGFNSTLVQHEVDHLNGVLFIDRISDTKRKRLMGK